MVGVLHTLLTHASHAHTCDAVRPQARDCQRREEASRAAALASREAQHASRLSEQMEFARQDMAFRIESRKAQEEEQNAHKREMERCVRCFIACAG